MCVCVCVCVCVCDVCVWVCDVCVMCEYASVCKVSVCVRDISMHVCLCVCCVCVCVTERGKCVCMFYQTFLCPSVQHKVIFLFTFVLFALSKAFTDLATDGSDDTDKRNRRLMIQQHAYSLHACVNTNGDLFQASSRKLPAVP